MTVTLTTMITMSAYITKMTRGVLFPKSITWTTCHIFMKHSLFLLILRDESLYCVLNGFWLADSFSRVHQIPPRFISFTLSLLSELCCWLHHPLELFECNFGWTALWSWNIMVKTKQYSFPVSHIFAMQFHGYLPEHYCYQHNLKGVIHTVSIKHFKHLGCF